MAKISAKMGDKYAIGTEHVIDGISVIVEEAKPVQPCAGCAFSFSVGLIPACNLPRDLRFPSEFHDGVCYDTERSDGKNIIFKRKEQQ